MLGSHHVMVFDEAGLHILKDYFEYCENYRMHLSLNKDAPVGRAVELPALGRVT
jgi:hypothetical protein